MDDAPAIDAAIVAAQKASGPAEVFIPAGRYLLASVRKYGLGYISIANAKNLTLTGEAGTRLIAADLNVNLIGIWRCDHVKVTKLDLDASSLTFTQGVIDAIDSAVSTVDIHADSGYDDIDRADFLKVEELKVFTNPDSGSWDQSTAPPKILSRERIGDHKWRLKLSAIKLEYVGKPWLFWRNIFRGWDFTMSENRDVVIDHINFITANNPFGIWRNPGDITLSNCRIGVTPGSGGLFCASGGMMVFLNRGLLTIDHCDFSRLDDDAVNMGTRFSRILQKGDERTVVVGKDSIDYTAGDTVTIWDWSTHRVRCTARIVKVDAPTPQTVQLTLDRSVEVKGMGAGNPKASLHEYAWDGIDRVVDMDTAGRLIVRNCLITSMRRTCLQVKASNSLIENNVFYNLHSPAIVVCPGFDWGEAPAASDVTIRNNTFQNMDVPGIRVGEIGSATAMDIKNIVIEGNRFDGLGGSPTTLGQMRGTAICVTNADGVHIRNNKFSGQSAEANHAPAIIVGRSVNIDVKGNQGLSGDLVAPGESRQWNSEY